MVSFVPLGGGGGDVAVAARSWHVAPWGSHGADGSVGAPLRTVDSAVKRATNGDTIVLRGGVYRESVDIYRKTIHLVSFEGERAVFDGSVAVNGWQHDGGQWHAEGWTRQFYREAPSGSVSSRNNIAGYADQLFIDGRPLRQVLQRSEVVPGTFWHEIDGDRLWIGDDPAGHRLEASDLRYGFYLNRADGSSLTNITVRRYASERNDMAAVRAYANNIVLQGVHVELNARIGVSAIGSNIVVRDSRFTDNGHLGLHGDRLNTIVVERVAIKGNNRAGFDSKHSAGGVKFTSSNGVTIRDSDVSYNDGPGIWTDLDTRNVTLARNLVSANGRAGIEIELSSNVNVLGNVVLDNGEAGIWVLESQNVQVLHNASYMNTNAIEVEEGPRRDVSNVQIRNNTVGRGKGGSQALITVNDWTQERSAIQMGVSIDYNAYWVPQGSGTGNLAKWGRWPGRLGYASDLDVLQQVTGQGYNSVMSVDDANPHARDPGSLDYRGFDSLRRGAAIHGSAAAEFDVPAGTRLRIGPVAPVVVR